MKILKLSVLILIITASISAQTIHEPTKAASGFSDAQGLLIEKGIELHNAKKFDEAIVLYKRVIEECPDCVLAIYETGLSYYGKKQYAEALQYLEEASKYKSVYLSDIYRIMGSVADDQGKREKAIEIYGRALKLAPDNYVLHYDIGVTYARLNKFDDAKKSFKKSIELAPGYVSPHYLLAEVFTATKYRIPALLASVRVLSLETDTARSKRANDIFMSIFQGNSKKDEKTGNTTIFLNMDGPTDEGDFGVIETMLSLSGAVADTKEEKKKSEEERFVSSLRSFFAMATETKMDANFVKTNYIGFVDAMQKKGYVEPFAYLILRQNGNKKADAWISANGSKMIEFVEWAKAYKP